jgi:transposase
MFTEGFWVQLILEKFLFQRPLYRVRQLLALEGFSVSQGTLTGGLKKIKDMAEPLYNQIIQRSRQADRWQMDETRWMVFAEIAGKIGYRWWLWVVVTRDTVVYLLDPTRSAKVPKEHLGPDAQGILSVDRYSAYKALSELIRLAYCWAHQRRDFIRIHKGYRSTRDWANAWIERINALFHINAQRPHPRCHIFFHRRDLGPGAVVGHDGRRRGVT